MLTKRTIDERVKAVCETWYEKNIHFDSVILLFAPSESRKNRKDFPYFAGPLSYNVTEMH